jgi:drug/metabolite transporter (DMT)-like permease
MTTSQNNSKGILFILMGMALFSIQDALIKFIYEDAALYELYFGRTFVALILLVGYLKFSKQKSKIKNSLSFFNNCKSYLFLFWVQFFLYFPNIYVSCNGKCFVFLKPFLCFNIGNNFFKRKGWE